MTAETAWVVLRPGVPVRLHLVDHVQEKRLIHDAKFGRDKTVDGMVFAVDEVDGVKINKEWSILSERLKALMLPYLVGKVYRSYEFTVTQLGSGFLTDYRLEVQPYLVSS